ncbi:hypothetical protein D3C79_772180 [compost metagenome]
MIVIQRDINGFGRVTLGDADGAAAGTGGTEFGGLIANGRLSRQRLGLRQLFDFDHIVARYRFGIGGDGELIVGAGGGVIKEIRFGQIFAQGIKLLQRAFQGTVSGQFGVVTGLLGGVGR